MPNNYVIGRGRLYFDRFNGLGAATGLRYLGNTPSISVAKNAQTVDHYDSDRGLKVKDRSITLQEDITATFSTDNISPENMALWWGGTVGAGAAQAAAPGQTALLVNVVNGISYPLGDHIDVTVTGVTMTAGGAVVPAERYEVDEAAGLITFNGMTAEGTDDVTVAYGAGAVDAGTVILDGSEAVFGRLRYVADNPVGANSNMDFGYVKLTASGNFDLKGDGWQALNFTVEVLRAASGLRYRIDQLAAAA